MAQEFSRRPLTADTPVRARVTHVEIVVDKEAMGISPSSSVFSCRHRSTVALHTYISSGGMNN
jgi:hypothetical protein